MTPELFESETSADGRMAGVFEFDGDTGYFYLYDTAISTGHKVVDARTTGCHRCGKGSDGGYRSGGGGSTGSADRDPGGEERAREHRWARLHRSCARSDARTRADAVGHREHDPDGPIRFGQSTWDDKVL